MKFPQETVDLVTFTEEIHNGKLYFLYIALDVAMKAVAFES